MDPPIKKRRGLWTLQQLKAAMEAVQGGLLSQRAAAVKYSIPRRTLVNHLKSGKIEKQIGRRTVLSAAQESDLESRLIRLASVGYPLTPKIIRHQVYMFCEQNNIPNNFNTLTKRAGKDWLKLFLKRHPNISKRKVQILNPGRAQKLNKEIVMHHFKEYKKIYDDLDIGNNPQRLYNMDEKGCRLTIHNQPLVLAQRGAKRVHMVAAEHAQNVTVAACVNASGTAIPPMIIFKGIKKKSEFEENLPHGTLVKMAPKGSMTSNLFIEFIHHLGKFKPPGKCLLVFDGASCHLDYRIVEAADEEDIILYCLPSNTTHELQPLDKTVNKSFEHHWDDQVLSFFYRHPERKLTKARFNPIFTKVWSNCMTHNNIVNGFKATGLYPYNPDAIPPKAFAPSELTEIPLVEGAARSLSINKQDSVKNYNYDSDSDKTFFDDKYPHSPSLLEPADLSNSNDFNIKKPERRLVDYSSSDTASSKSLVSPKPSTSGIQKSRPIIYSTDSASDTPEELMPQTRSRVNHCQNIYTSSEDENDDPRRDYTPIKIKLRRKKSDESMSSDKSEDNVPLEQLKLRKYVKSSFHQLIPTPNFAVVKDKKPRRKAINYKAQIVKKDLFKEKENEKSIKPKIIKRKQKSPKKLYAKKNKIDKGLRENKTNAKNKKNKTEISQKKRTSTKNKMINNDDKWYCHACKTESFEDMRQCPFCQRWFHEQCLGLTKEDKHFDCPMCG